MQNIVRITYPFLWVAVFARQLCLPVPAIFFLMTAGALAGRGELQIGLVLVVSTLGCLAADFIWFQAGRRWGTRTIRLLCSLSADPRFCIQRAKNSFERWGLPSVMTIKLLPGLDVIIPPLAGAEGANGVPQSLLAGAGERQVRRMLYGLRSSGGSGAGGAAGLYFCWFLLFPPDYEMRSGLGSDQVLAVARVFIALFLRSDDSLLDACISDLSSIEKGPRWVICRKAGFTSISNNLGCVNAFLNVKRHSLRGAVSLRFG
jgi:hypothetical protein